MRYALIGVLLFVYAFPVTSHAQDQPGLADKVINFPSKFFSRLQSRTADLDKQLTRQTEKYLDKMARREAKIKRKLSGMDSAGAARLFNTSAGDQYTLLARKLKNDSGSVIHSMGPEYLPYADSLQTTLAFLNKNPQLLSSSKFSPADIQATLARMTQLQSRLQDADLIKQFVQDRKAQLQQYLSQYTQLPSGITGALQGYNKQAYYYADQVRQYRQMLNDPDRMMKTALGLLAKLPAFSSFMHNNSFLSGLFSVPDNYGTSDGLAGLQTRDQLLAMIQSQVGQGGPNGTAAIQQSLQTAQADINKMRDKLSSLGGSSSGDMDMPGFKPNPQKTKTFWKRIEYGVNLQTTNATNYFPTYSDIGLSLGYKLNQSNVIGIGASYKLGWGTGFNHIALTSQGAGIRSFLDIKIKASFSATGGLEYNYTTPFTSLQQVRHLNDWTQSGLIGVSKTVSMKSRVFKKTKLQLLWDFLSYQQIPRTQPILFRIGYGF
ncbi:MAG TPA: hypothetical protein VK563_00265 [Puia sp.]|nr:hypothetical protein [Puia sp.]